MERILRNRVIRPLPGDRQGTFGATAESDSTRTGGDRELNRRAAVGFEPEMDTAEETQNSRDPTPSHTPTPVESVSQRGNPLLAGTTEAGRARQRMKWSEEVNIFIMRSYYIITNMETDLTAYRNQLHQKFMEKYPTVNVSAQRISDQRRAIMRNNLIPAMTLAQIKSDVRNELQHITNQEADHTREDNIELEHEINNQQPRQQPESNAQENQAPNINLNLTEELQEKFQTALTQYSGMDPTKRPIIPKQKTSIKMAKIVHVMNTEILPAHLTSVQSFEDLHTSLYCAALAAAQSNGSRIFPHNPSNKGHTPRKPCWQQRIEKKIKRLRQDLSRMIEYARGNRSKNICKRVKEIQVRYKVHSSHEIQNRNTDEFIDTLKQKLSVQSSRHKRYTKSMQRKQHNTHFQNNERGFYRTLNSSRNNQTEKTTQENQIPPRQEVHRFWSSIWSNPINHNDNAAWIAKELEDLIEMEEMAESVIDLKTMTDVIKGSHNWKATGSDRIHNYWYKKLTCIYPYLLRYINQWLQEPQLLPSFLTQGITYLLPKGQTTNDPSKYRPITCLQTLYKIITACIAKLINNHIETHKILNEEQKGCKKGARGCKEQLIIDQIVLKQACSKQRNLHMCYIDYKKAYDSVPHSWLLRVLEIYKVSLPIRQFLDCAMHKWQTVINIKTQQGCLETESINIRRGIFQGDSLSALWFCLALNPLSNALNTSKYGFDLKSTEHTKTLSHLLYMDDLKIYAGTERKLKQLIKLVEVFTTDVKMEFGLDKCRTLSFKKGSIELNEVEMEQGEAIEAMDRGDTYKYLGMLQSKRTEHTIIKKQLTNEFTNRIKSILKTRLNIRNIVKSINTYAIPVLTYSFGTITWTNTDLDRLERIIRTEMTRHCMHHKNASALRLTLPKNEGGLGILDIHKVHNTQIKNLRSYFHSRINESRLHEVVCSADKEYTPLNLHDQEIQLNESILTTDEKLNTWKSKALHGRHALELSRPDVDKDASNAWLNMGELFPETAGYMIAIQDQVINTKNYRKYILKDPSITDDACRKCLEKTENIQHIIGACKFLAQNDYTHRHNQVASIVHQSLAIKNSLITDTTPYYKYKPPAVMENADYKLYYDRTILTDATINNNRPDIVLQDKTKRETYIIDIAVPNTHNITNTIQEKIRKYSDLKFEITRMWGMNKVYTVPIVISSTGIVPKNLLDNLKFLSLSPNILKYMQKAVILNTCRIVRKFLQDQ